tara:strand:+ start:86 stop:463 length:378 start_codon:yes stop_codon:yes gene_type:complete
MGKTTGVYRAVQHISGKKFSTSAKDIANTIDKRLDDLGFTQDTLGQIHTEILDMGKYSTAAVQNVVNKYQNYLNVILRARRIDSINNPRVTAHPSTANMRQRKSKGGPVTKKARRSVKKDNRGNR